MTAWLFDAPVERRPAQALDITMRFEGDVTVCALAGPLCAYTAPTLDAWLGQLRGNGRTCVIVDLASLASLSGDGADVLRDHAAGFSEAGGTLRVRAASAASAQVLRLCDAEHLLEG